MRPTAYAYLGLVALVLCTLPTSASAVQPLLAWVPWAHGPNTLVTPKRTVSQDPNEALLVRRLGDPEHPEIGDPFESFRVRRIGDPEYPEIGDPDTPFLSLKTRVGSRISGDPHEPDESFRFRKVGDPEIPHADPEDPQQVSGIRNVSHRILMWLQRMTGRAL
jgi:hypothetical protein